MGRAGIFGSLVSGESYSATRKNVICDKKTKHATIFIYLVAGCKNPVQLSACFEAAAIAR
jgi:hypothetical protein